MDWLIAKIRDSVQSSPTGGKRLILGAGAAAFLAIVFIATNSNPAAEPLEAEPSHSSSADSQISQPEIFVHIVGAVVSPGIYKLSPGDRVMDVVFAAGGFLANSDQASVNLARAVTDGEQVLVFEKGNNSNTAAVNGASQLMSLSRASAAELESLPGIGPTIAGRIIDWREANGGFKAVKDLLKVSGVGQKLFDGLKGEVSP